MVSELEKIICYIYTAIYEKKYKQKTPKDYGKITHFSDRFQVEMHPQDCYILQHTTWDCMSI